MQQFLAAMEQSALQSRSQLTPQREDDAMVTEIVFLNDQLEQTHKQSSLLALEERQWNDRVEGLQDILQRFRRSEFDSQRSFFAAEFDADQFLDRYLRGQLGREDFWSIIRQHHQFAPPWWENSDDHHGWGVDTELSHVLMRVLVDVAGNALRNSAYRGMHRRGPIRQKQRMQSGRPRFRNHGFTSGRGF